MDGKDVTRRDHGAVESTRNLRQVLPLVDIYENNDEILLHAEMPGVRKDDITINVDNGNLTLSGVRSVARGGAADWEEFQAPRNDQRFEAGKSGKANVMPRLAQCPAQGRAGQHVAARAQGNDGYVHIISEAPR